MGLWKGLLIAGAAALAWNAGPEARAQERLPIFDAHVHYSRAAWAEYPPKRVLEILAAAGVTGALVSSTPDDGTLMLHGAAPGRIVPILRPYREPGDMSGWARSGALLAYVDARVKRGIYKGIGEFHLFSVEDARTATLRTLARIALERDIVLHVHSGAAPILAILAHEPKVRILWAHAGMSEPPGAVREVMDKHPGLLTELSFRAGDIAPGGKIDPEWRAENIVTVEVPLLGTMHCHRAIVPLVTGAMQELADRGLEHLVDPTTFRGCFNSRFIAGRRDLSRHAWGVALDINWGANPTGLASAQDPRLVETMDRWGFTSGHEWLIPDPGHFEWHHVPTAGG